MTPGQSSLNLCESGFLDVPYELGPNIRINCDRPFKVDSGYLIFPRMKDDHEYDILVWVDSGQKQALKCRFIPDLKSPAYEREWDVTYRYNILQITMQGWHVPTLILGNRTLKVRGGN